MPDESTPAEVADADASGSLPIATGSPSIASSMLPEHAADAVSALREAGRHATTHTDLWDALIDRVEAWVRSVERRIGG
jgi:hypothetical protein